MVDMCVFKAHAVKVPPSTCVCSLKKIHYKGSLTESLVFCDTFLLTMHCIHSLRIKNKRVISASLINNT